MSFMDILKAREIDPFLYRQAKKRNISRQEMDMAYDIFEKDYIKKILLHVVKNDKNPLSYKLKDTKASKETYLPQDSYLNTISKLLRKFIENVSFKSLVRYEEETKVKLSIEERNEIDDLKDVLYGLSMLDKNTKLGSKKIKPKRSETRKKQTSSLLEKVFTIVAKNGFRLEDEDVQEFKNKFEKVDINKIVSFFLDGKPLRQLHSVLLEDTSAEWDDSEEDWMIDGQIAYKNYSGKNSKELFNEIVEGLGIKTLSRKDISASRGSLLEHFKLDFETLTEEIMTIIPKQADEYTDEDNKLLFRSPHGKLESVLIDIANETDELQDKLEPHLRQPSQSELNEVEKYLDVIEFIITLLKLRGSYVPSPNIEEPLNDIDVPRDVDLEREFPELEQAGMNFFNQSNVRKRLGE